MTTSKVIYVDPREWRPTRFGDFRYEQQQRGAEDTWDTGLWQYALDDKVDEMGPKFILSLMREGVHSPVDVVLDPSGETEMWNGHHRWFGAYLLGQKVPIRLHFREGDPHDSNRNAYITDPSAPSEFANPNRIPSAR